LLDGLVTILRAHRHAGEQGIFGILGDVAAIG
jgi:hypothetical protein